MANSTFIYTNEEKLIQAREAIKELIAGIRCEVNQEGKIYTRR